MTNENNTFEISAGEKFRFREWLPEAPKAAILGVHGYAEHLGRYEHVAEFFASRGFSFHMMENRGHGESVGRRGFIERYDQFIDDLHFFRQKVEKKTEGRPLFLLGHSNGSLISARYALQHGDGIAGVILSGLPFPSGVSIHPIKLKAIFLLKGVIPKFSPPSEIDPKALCHDEAVVKEYIADPLVHKIMSVRMAYELFTAMGDLEARAGGFARPLLMLHGGGDSICGPQGARDFFGKTASTDKEIEIYDGLYHEIFNEPEKEQVLARAAAWMEKRI